MKKFLKILIRHKWAVFLAVLVGIIMAFPQAYFRYDYKDIYQGIDLKFTDAEPFYWNRIQEVRDGYFLLGSVYLAEGKDSPYLQPPLSEIIVASLGNIFFLDTKNTILLSRFLFPILVFLFIYALVYKLTKRRVIGLISSSLILLTDNLQSIYSLLFNQTLQNNALSYARPVCPQVHLLFFFSFLLFFWIFLQKKKWLYGLISALILGLSFYTYPYTWTFIYAFLGLLSFIFLWQKRWMDIRNIILIGISSSLIAIPYFINLFYAFHHPLYSEASLRFGMIKSYTPQIGIVVVLLLLIFLFFSKKFKERYYFSLALILTPLIVLNQQIVTGFAMIPDHYHWYYHRPLLIIFLIIIVFERLTLITNKLIYRKFYYSFVLLILSISLLNGFIIQLNNYNLHSKNSLEQQRYGSIFNWLNNYAFKDEMVFTNLDISNLISGYTSLNVWNFHHAGYYLVSNEVTQKGLFLNYRLDGLNKEQAMERFLKDRKDISHYLYNEHYRKKFGAYSKIPDEKISYLVERYIEFLNDSFDSVLREYNIKYIVWDIQNQPNWQLDDYSFLEPAYQKDGIAIYKVK